MNPLRRLINIALGMVRRRQPKPDTQPVEAGAPSDEPWPFPIFIARYPPAHFVGLPWQCAAVGVNVNVPISLSLYGRIGSEAFLTQIVSKDRQDARPLALLLVAALSGGAGL